MSDALGGVLSTRRPVTSVEVVELLARSVTTTRRSYRPSVSCVVSHACAIGVQVFAPAADFWNVIVLTPEPPVSSATAVRLTVWRRFAPGSVSAAVGGSVSISATAEVVYVVELPTLSETT